MENHPEKESREDTKKKTSLWDRFIDFLFSNDLRKHLIWIVLLGLMLRIFVARNISVLGDEMIHGPHAIGFLNSGLISTILHSPLWFSLTDLSHIIFGNVTLLSSRFPSVFFGAMTILVVYLIGSEAFNKRVGIFSASSLVNTM